MFATQERTMASDDDAADLPMDGFSVMARAAVELGQQSENALSYLDRKTAAQQSAERGTAWPRDLAKAGAICQVVVRDVGFNRGVVLWRAVGLLVGGVSGTNGGEHISYVPVYWYDMYIMASFQQSKLYIMASFQQTAGQSQRVQRTFLLRGYLHTTAGVSRTYSPTYR